MPKRAYWICGIFAAELVAIMLAFQVLASVECRLTGIEMACRGLRGAVVRTMCLGALVGVYLWASDTAREGFVRMAAARTATGGRGWAVLHAVALAAGFAPLLAVAPGALNQSFAVVFPVLATGGALAVLGGLFWLAAPADWLNWFRRRTGILLLLALTAMLLPDIAAAIGPLWYWDILTETTFLAVALVMLLFSDALVVVPHRQIIGIEDFTVAVADSCSGVEGFALIATFMGIYAYLFRDTLRMGRYWAVVLPLALLMSWMLNVVRIALLVLIGAHVSPELAQNGFHSFAGWLFFILLAFGVLVTVNRVAWLQRRPGAAPAAGVRLADDDIAARIVPFIVFMLSGVVVQAFWQEPALGFPLQAAMMALVLWWVRRPLAAYVARPDGIALAGGVAIGAGWVLAAPPPEATPAPLLALAPGVLAVWAAIRILGTALLVPVVEELFFRGYVQARIDTGRVPGRVISVAVSAALFAALHGRWIEAGISGVVLSLIYLRRGLLADAIAAHVVANSLIAAVAVWRGDWSLI